MTSHDAVRSAASELPQPFAFAALLLATWHRHPEAFGLDGMKLIHPDARKLQNILYGCKGAIRKGYIQKSGEWFRFNPNETPMNAYELFCSGRKEEISFQQACEFWGLPQNLKDCKVAERIAAFGVSLNGRETPGERVQGACHDWLTEKFAKQVNLADGRQAKPRGKHAATPKAKAHMDRLTNGRQP